MSSRSLNKVQLIGNLTRDPELRYTPQGTPVCTIGIATNRSWVDSNGQRQEETEFHRVVAWSKLAELCSQLLFKSRKVFVEGRLQTRRWTAQDGTERQTTEVVIDDMIILDSRRRDGADSRGDDSEDVVDDFGVNEEVIVDDLALTSAAPVEELVKEPVKVKVESKAVKVEKSDNKDESINADDLEF